MSDSPLNNRPPIGFRPLQNLIVVAALIATLFTAWTEPGLLPSSLVEKVNLAMPPGSATALPSWPTPVPRSLPSIGIVAGHSGNDTGAVCPEELGGIREVDINLAVANLVREALLQEGYAVDILAEFDPLLQGYQALALVSIHADSCQYINDEATGFKVAAALSTSYPEQTLRLITCLSDRYQKATGLKFHLGSVTNDMTSYHAFDEINPNTPAAIIEIGFMNLDYEILTQRQTDVARGITNGILCFARNEDISQNQNQP